MADKTTEQSVEDCLKELREFPDVEIRFTARANSQGWRVWVGLRGGNFYGPTLDQAMEEFRQWHAEQAKR